MLELIQPSQVSTFGLISIIILIVFSIIIIIKMVMKITAKVSSGLEIHPGQIPATMLVTKNGSQQMMNTPITFT